MTTRISDEIKEEKKISCSSDILSTLMFFFFISIYTSLLAIVFFEIRRKKKIIYLTIYMYVYVIHGDISFSFFFSDILSARTQKRKDVK